MDERHLSSLDPARFMKASGWNFNKSWTGRVDISAWLHASMAANSSLYLFLVYQDQENTHSVPVDQCLIPTSESILLNARIKLSGRGNLQSLQLKIKCAGCNTSAILLEDLSVKALKPASARRVSEVV